MREGVAEDVNDVAVVLLLIGLRRIESHHVNILAEVVGKVTAIGPKSLNGFLNPTFQGKLVQIANLDGIASLISCLTV